MEIIDQDVPGLYLVRLKRIEDPRGCFVKTYAHSTYASAQIADDFREEFYSISEKDVIRGMHFQVPPHDHAKLVYCAVGAVEDVVLDLRLGANYGKFLSFRLSAETPCALIIPKGMAHGFRSLVDNSLMVYKTTSEHDAAHDRGIRWDSFGYDWSLSKPILSSRDCNHLKFEGLVSPFLTS